PVSFPCNNQCDLVEYVSVELPLSSPCPYPRSASPILVVWAGGLESRLELLSQSPDGTGEVFASSLLSPHCVLKRRAHGSLFSLFCFGCLIEAIPSRITCKLEPK